jgi:MFS family permease
MNITKSVGVKLRSLIFSAQSSSQADQNKSTVLGGLMVATAAMALNLGMFGVATPLIRNDFGIQADMAAWVVTIYTLPFMIFMPLFGRLADALGKKRLFIAGMVIFIIGSAINLFAASLPWIMLGRAIQGLGSAGINPLCIAIISQIFDPAERGKVMGTWNSVIPLTNMIGPVTGGLLIDSFGWRSIYIPIMLGNVLAMIVVLKKLPAMPGTTSAGRGFLRRFDWGGVLLMGATLTSLLFYASSRPIKALFQSLFEPEYL